jgi:hypothetical protein
LYQNVWTNNASSENAITLVTELDNDYMTVSAFLSDIIIKLFKSVLELYGLDDYLYWVWGYVFSIMSDHMNDMPEPVVTSVSEAMHFQRGLHALVVRAMEFNVGLADDGSGQPDWALVQAAWWGVHDLVAAYEQSGKFPVDTVIEMRLLGGSDMHLAPYQGNAHGTISIEICSSILVPFELWEEFKVNLLFAHMPRFFYHCSITVHDAPISNVHSKQCSVIFIRMVKGRLYNELENKTSCLYIIYSYCCNI